MGMVHRRLLERATNINGSQIISPSGSDDPYEPKFDSNMVIILVVLVCALIFTIGLNTIARCGLRYLISGRSSSNQQKASPGLKKRAFLGLSVEVYGSGPGMECPICLGEFEDGERIRVLPKCNHGFHVECIDKWLVSHASCPNCRVSLLEPIPSIELGPVAAHDHFV